MSVTSGNNPNSSSTSHDSNNPMQELQAKRYASDTKDRKWLAFWAAFVVTGWLTFVTYLLLKNDKHYFLSDTVLVALLGTTTLNILGLTFIVLRGHFDRPSNK